MTAFAASMAVRAGDIGTWTRVWDSVAEERWLQGYAAAVGDASSDVLDLAHPGGIVAHPVFVACPEWPIVLDAYPAINMPLPARRRGLHVAHAIVHHQPIRAGDELRTRARLVTAEMRSVGAFLKVEFATETGAGLPRATTTLSMLYPGVMLDGARPRAHVSPAPEGMPATETVGAFSVSGLNAPVYTECARIWNPIHTDARVAAEHGLPAPVLHGTEILARAVSLLKNDYLLVGAASVSSVRCRFRGMVLPGMALTVRASPVEEKEDSWTVNFEVLIGDAGAAITGGVLTGLRRTPGT